METNAGTKKMTLEGTVIGLAERAHFDAGLMANVLGLSTMVKTNRVTYDSAVEDAFIMHHGSEQTKFKANKDGLYEFRPPPEFLAEVARIKNLKPPTTPCGVAQSHLIASVKENRKNYTERQFKDAKKARDLAHVLGCPTIENLKLLLRQKLIKNCEVTTDDVNIAEKIFGPDVGAIKGKWTRSKPPIVKDDWVEIPSEISGIHQDLDYCMDIIHVNGKPALTGIDKSVKYRSAVPMKSRTKEVLYDAMDKILRFYNTAGYTVGCIHCDPEFTPLLEPIRDALDVEVNYCPAQAHVPEAERNIRTIKERMRSVFHGLPYKRIPRVMLDHLLMAVTMMLNVFPAKGGVSEYYSPHVLMNKTDLDYKKHCMIPFGAYVQAFQENKPSNTLEARAIDGIYLRPMRNRQGGHEIMNLATGLVITRHKVTALPITDSAIKAVERMAEEQGIGPLKIEGRNKQPLHPGNWIAGVDYDEELDEIFDDDYEDQDENLAPDDNSLEDADYNPINQDEIDDLLADERDNPTARDDESSQGTVPDLLDQDFSSDDESFQPDDASSDGDSIMDELEPEEPSISRPIRDRKPVERLGFSSVKSRRSAGRGSKRTAKHKQMNFVEVCHNLVADDDRDPSMDLEYTEELACVLARAICDMNSKGTAHGASFGQQYMLHKATKVFGKDKAFDAALKELDQLH
jgi:hypothetical protein